MFMSLGRVTSLRSSGAKLLFIDVIQGGQKVQGLCDLARLSQAGINESEFRRFTHQIKRGDIYSKLPDLLNSPPKTYILQESKG